MLWKKAFHMCKHTRNSMVTSGSTTSQLGTLYREKFKVIVSFLEFGCVGYIAKREKFRNKMTDKKFKVIMVGYAANNTRDTYKL